MTSLGSSQDPRRSFTHHQGAGGGGASSNGIGLGLLNNFRETSSTGGGGGGGGGGGTRRRRNSSISRRPLSLKNGVFSPRRTGAFLTRCFGILVLVVIVYWLFSKKAPIKPESLKTKWWEADSPEHDQAKRMLLPKPMQLPKPPRPKIIPDVTHSLAQIIRLPSSFKSAASSDWTGIIHITSATQYPLLSTLVPSLLAQSIPPNRIIVFAAKGLTPPIKTFGPALSIQSYAPSRPVIVSFLDLVIPAVTTDHVLFVDGHFDLIDSNFVPRLLHASGTKPYRSSLLSAGGLILPISLDAPPTSCVGIGSSSSLDVDDAIHNSRSKRVHVPSTPFLFQASWMKSISNGIRTDVEIEVAIALGLWTKAGIPSFSLPIPLVASASSSKHSGRNQYSGTSTYGCERLKRSLQGVGVDRRIGPLFRPEAAGGGGLGQAGAQSLSKINDPYASGKRFARDLGAIVILLSGENELELASTLACGLAQENDVRVFVADLPRSKNGGGKRVLYNDADTGAHCHMDIHALGTGKESESVSLAVLDEIDLIGKVAVAFYLADGHRGREYEEVLKWNRGILGPGRGGKRRNRKQMDAEKGAVIISLDRNEMQLADWIAALPLDALRHWHTPRIDLSIVTNNRPKSLRRLLSSLVTAHYFGDEVALYVNLEQTADMVTQNLTFDLDWPYGLYTPRHRIVMGGLMTVIVESWFPANNDTYGVFLEDDVQVSPMFYGWLKMSILYYRYSKSMRERSTRLFGVAMYQQKFLELRPEGRQPFDAHLLFDSLALDPTLPYLSQVPCSWGAVYFPEVWREFHLYLALRLSETAMSIADQIVPELRSNKWPQSWKKYMNELIYLRGYVMLYPNYANDTSLSVNHAEAGTHIKIALQTGSKTKQEFDVPLMTRYQSLLSLPSGRLPSFENLPILDFWGMLATDEDIIERGWQSTVLLDSCPIPFRLDLPPTYNSRELLCPKEYERVDRYIATQPLAPSLNVLHAQREREAQQILKDRETAANARIAAALSKEEGGRERPMMVPHPDGAAEELFGQQRDSIHKITAALKKKEAEYQKNEELRRKQEVEAKAERQRQPGPPPVMQPPSEEVEDSTIEEDEDELGGEDDEKRVEEPRRPKDDRDHDEDDRSAQLDDEAGLDTKKVLSIVDQKDTEPMAVVDHLPAGDDSSSASPNDVDDGEEEVDDVDVDDVETSQSSREGDVPRVTREQLEQGAAAIVRRRKFETEEGLEYE